MENLVSDLKDALELNLKPENKTKKTSHRDHRHRHHSHHHHHRRAFSSNKKKRISCFQLPNSLSKINENLMKVIISSNAVSSNALSSLINGSALSSPVNFSATSFGNLVRFKQAPNKTTMTRTKCLVKTKAPRKLFKIQKTFRFRNYRLRCIRLRRESKQKQRRHNKKLQYEKTSFNCVDQNSDTINVLSSGLDSSEYSNLSATSNSFSSLTSTSEDECDTLSLTECFKTTKFLNSSDPKEDEEDKNVSTASNSKIDTSHMKTSKPRSKKKFDKPNKLVKQSSQINFAQSEVFKRKRDKVEDEDELEANSAVGNCRYKLDAVKKMRLKTTLDKPYVKLAGANIKSKLTLQSKSLRKNTKPIRTEETSEKESENEYKKCNIKKTAHRAKLNKSNDDEEQTPDDREADDEQSDWPNNETVKMNQKVSEKSSNHKNKNSSSSISSDQIEEDPVECTTQAIPWWNEGVEIGKKSYSDVCLRNTNYEVLNSREPAENSADIDELFNGALSLLNNPNYKNEFKTKSQRQPGKRWSHKVRSNSLATGSMKLATKSASHFSDFETPPAEIPITNKGNKMLQKMGWQPGTSIGADPTNPNSLINPIMPVKRPKKIGLGYIK